MYTFTVILDRFANKGEKTGWTIAHMPDAVYKKFKRPDKKEFRVKGFIDDVAVDKLVVYPIGGGRFIIALNAALRKKLGKEAGDKVAFKLELDAAGGLRSPEMIEALKEDGVAWMAFQALNVSHQNYFHRYVATAKRADTKAGRIVETILALHKGLNFGEMIRAQKQNKN